MTVRGYGGSCMYLFREWSSREYSLTGTLLEQFSSSPPLQDRQTCMLSVYQISSSECWKIGYGGRWGTTSWQCTTLYRCKCSLVQSAISLLPTLGSPKVQTSPRVQVFPSYSPQKVVMAPPREWPVMSTALNWVEVFRAASWLRTKGLSYYQDCRKPEWALQGWQPGQSANFPLKSSTRLGRFLVPLNATSAFCLLGLQATTTCSTQVWLWKTERLLRWSWLHWAQVVLRIWSAGRQARLLALAMQLATSGSQTAAARPSKVDIILLCTGIIKQETDSLRLVFLDQARIQLLLTQSHIGIGRYLGD